MAGFLTVPENITSIIEGDLKDFQDISPIHHLMESTTFDLPQPFGPITQVIPGLSGNFVLLENDLNPCNSIALRYILSSQIYVKLLLYQKYRVMIKTLTVRV